MPKAISRILNVFRERRISHKMSSVGGDPHGSKEENVLNWAFSILDTSRVSTFFISILLIVYGSFRSLAMEEEDDNEDEDECSRSSSKHSSGVQTLDSLQAMCLPLGASISLMIMFFFFDSMQILFAICTAVIATVALAFLLLPMCQYFLR